MMAKGTMKKILILGTAMLFLLGLCACGKATVQIQDGGVMTELEVSVPSTVEKILKDADIVLNDGDEVSPSLDTKIKDAQEIVISRKVTVKLTVDGETRDIVMVGGTISDLLAQEGITLGEKQHVNYDLNEYLTDGMEVKILYSFNVEVVCDGKTQKQETEAETVDAVLKELNITLGADDRVTPDVTAAVTDNMQIIVNRITYDTVVEKETIEYETIREEDSSITQGQEQISVSGENGEKEVTYKVTYVDGVEDAREAVEETVTKEAVNEVIKVGTKVASGSGGSGGGREEVSRKAFYDCDGSGHGYYEITYSDGTVEYVDF
ncbi:MAG: ubiquitin-like domain-containing protein [Muribaculaceae bacterium]|nr:ubiquitin-like domain-containing protein [Muribaculaceae bacterium]MCM1398866.1 ubiquitin-like domain-containing protein [Clostridium sp.]MCM1458503.1 ubiquitin-like domain-containing protein [Bacteroides sp.]